MSDDYQPINVIFDTGSDYLAVTSNLCVDPKYGPVPKSLKPKVEGKVPSKDKLLYEEDFVQITDIKDAEDNNDDKTAQLLSDAKEGADGPQPRCDTVAYKIPNSSEAKNLGEDEMTLNYGTAHLRGYLY